MLLFVGASAIVAFFAHAEITERHWYNGADGSMLDEACWDNGDWTWELPGTVPGPCSRCAHRFRIVVPRRKALLRPVAISA